LNLHSTENLDVSSLSTERILGVRQTLFRGAIECGIKPRHSRGALVKRHRIDQGQMFTRERVAVTGLEPALVRSVEKRFAALGSAVSKQLWVLSRLFTCRPRLQQRGPLSALLN
jgi:hypothetical protein